MSILNKIKILALPFLLMLPDCAEAGYVSSKPLYKNIFFYTGDEIFLIIENNIVLLIIYFISTVIAKKLARKSTKNTDFNLFINLLFGAFVMGLFFSTEILTSNLIISIIANIVIIVKIIKSPQLKK